MQQNILERIEQYYEESCRVERVLLLDEGESPDHHHFVIIPKNAAVPPILTRKHEMTQPEFVSIQQPCVTLNVMALDEMENQRIWYEKNGLIPNGRELQRKELYGITYEAMCHEVPDLDYDDGVMVKRISNIALAVHLDSPTFAEIRQVMALFLDTQVWENNGCEFYMRGDAKLMELPSCREDVWEMILSHMVSKEWKGEGFPLKVMRKVSYGRYSRKNSMDEETKRILRELEIPEWYIRCLERIDYLWTRIGVIDDLFFLMRTILHEKEMEP